MAGEAQDKYIGSEQFNKMSNLFALAVSDVLIVNFWTQEINRVSGCCTDLIKTILEVNLKLFSDQPVKKLVFLLRDFDDESENWGALVENFKSVLNSIWEDIFKPQRFQNKQLFEVF